MPPKFQAPTAGGLPTFNFGNAPGLPNASNSAFNGGNDDEEEEEDEEGEDGDYMEEIPETAETRELTKLQADYDAVTSRLNAEQRELLKKYDNEFASINMKRRDIISGLTPVAPLEGAKVVSLDADAVSPGIPEFWLTVLKNCNLNQIIEEHDEALLSSLTDITTNIITGEKPGFSVHFHFAKNDYFTHDTLSITLTIPDFPDSDDVEDITSTSIVWKNKMNLTKTKNGKQARESFFHIFDETNIEGLDENDEEFERAMGIREMCATTCFIIREKIVPNAINWYTGAAVEEEEYEDGEGEYEEGDEIEEGEEDDEGGEGGATAAEGEKPECKQQ